MIILFDPENSEASVAQAEERARSFPGITPRRCVHSGADHTVTELHLIGPTAGVLTEVFEEMPGVVRVVRVSAKYRLVGCHDLRFQTVDFSYNGVAFDERQVHVFAGLCAVDTPEHVERTMRGIAAAGLVTTRMGDYKPRTSPYDFQGLGRDCLPWVFDLAAEHGIRVIAMEVTNARHIDEIHGALDRNGRQTGVMLQVGTRNAQNFERLRQVG